MRNYYVIALSAALLAGGSVFAQSTQHFLTKSRLTSLQKSGRLPLAAKSLNLQARQLPDASNKALKTSPEKSQVYDNIVSDQPEGTLHAADIRNGYYTYSFWGYIMGGAYSGSVGTYVVTDDAIYLKNPFNGFNTNSWLRIDKTADGKYVARLPQPIYEENGVTYYASHLKLTSTDDGGKTFVADTTAAGSDAYYSYDKGVLSMVDSTYDASGFPSGAVGLTDADGNWYGYLDAAVVIKPNTYHKAVVPDGAQYSKYALESNSYSAYDIGKGFQESNDTTNALVDVARFNDSIYINNPYSKDPTSWIKGIVKGGKATFLPQYVGIDSTNNIHVWFEPATFTVGLDSTYFEEYGEVDKYRVYSIADKLEMSVDPASNVLTSPKNTSFLINASPEKVNYVSTFDELSLTPWTETAATPSDPVVNSVNETYNTEGYATVNMTLSPLDTDGKVMNTDKVYYNVYTSDEPDKPFELTEDEGYEYYSYPDSVNIPYTYTDGMDIGASGSNHIWCVYFDTNDIDSVGVQVFYNGAGELRHSNLVWFSLVPQHAAAGIKTIGGEASGVNGVTYYDISGRRIAAPKQAGVYIMETTYADGTKKGVKILKK